MVRLWVNVFVSGQARVYDENERKKERKRERERTKNYACDEIIQLP